MYWHRIFEDMVGRHTNYVDNHRVDENFVECRTSMLFYDKAKERTTIDISQNKVLGWFER